MVSRLIQWLLVVQLLTSHYLVLSRTTYPSDLDLDVILGISPGTTTIDYDQADFDEQAFGPSYGGDSIVKSADSKSNNDGKGTTGVETSNKSDGNTRFRMIRRPDSNDNVDGPVLSDTGADDNQISAENNVVLGGTSGGKSGAVSAEVLDPDLDIDNDPPNTDGNGKSLGQASPKEITDKPMRWRSNSEKTSTKASSNEVTGASSNEVTGASSNEVTGASSSKVTGKPKTSTKDGGKPKGTNDKDSSQTSSNEITDKPNGSNKGVTPPSSAEKSKSSKQNGASAKQDSATTGNSSPSNWTFSSCFRDSASQSSQTDFCRFANAVYSVCDAQFPSVCPGSKSSRQSNEPASYASEESMDSSSLDSTDFDSLTASLESLSASLDSFGSSEVGSNELGEVLKIVKGLCPNVCSVAKHSDGPAAGIGSSAESADMSINSAVMDDSYDNESNEVGPDTEDDDEYANGGERENEGSDEDSAKTTNRGYNRAQRSKDSTGRKRNGRSSAGSKDRKTSRNKGREIESESDSD